MSSSMLSQVSNESRLQTQSTFESPSLKPAGSASTESSHLARKILLSKEMVVIDSEGWKTHLDATVEGNEPKIPDDIDPKAKFRDTALTIAQGAFLLYKPEKVNGKDLNFDLLLELFAKKYPNKANGKGAVHVWPDYQKEHGTASFGKSYWLLVSRAPIAETKNKTFAEQQKIIHMTKCPEVELKQKEISLRVNTTTTSLSLRIPENSSIRSLEMSMPIDGTNQNIQMKLNLQMSTLMAPNQAANTTEKKPKRNWDTPYVLELAAAVILFREQTGLRIYPSGSGSQCQEQAIVDHVYKKGIIEGVRVANCNPLIGYPYVMMGAVQRFIED